MESLLKETQKTILLVEDTALVLNTVRMILERAKFTVLAAASATEGIRLAGSDQTIHLLLSDVMMPDMSGPDLALKLKASAGDASDPDVWLSRWRNAGSQLWLVFHSKALCCCPARGEDQRSVK